MPFTLLDDYWQYCVIDDGIISEISLQKTSHGQVCVKQAQ